MKKTILHDSHLKHSAKMAPFGGFLMPIQYEGIVIEHTATRSAAALFDTCHMGEFFVEGAHATADLDRIFTCDLSSLKVGRCRNGFMCNEAGGVIDDLIIYRLEPNRYMVVVNAATQDNDFEWIGSHLSTGTTISNVSQETAKMDLQGPAAPRILQKLVAEDLSTMVFYEHRTVTARGESLFVSRTGYTGEIGFEIYCTLKTALWLWDELLATGAQAAGLGARDTLRLEMGFPLYGHELNQSRNAAESGFSRLIASGKDFIGSDAIRDESRCKQLLVALLIQGRRSARAEDVILDADGTEVGIVTSGSFSPCLGQGIALGYVDKRVAMPGTLLAIRTARQDLLARVVDKPFYKSGTGRKPLSEFL